ncbi:tol-pal system protein YbgF [Pseudoalteromonas tunicata]|jgi:tol-pal system protein YbgF|uniref:Cell division coordinator CpoB n=1 Tax=Pseudoalteromonas tunicata D2 TaxID=87626 RepID=A4CFH7_9GAMM|nr:tol-pal system protein YbgF [Pseudoalteromonas tunicata]ATC95187.1 hypothetical protein PTUN_a2754 [Pseudoalteromonas tunicata]AXT30798.1 tol-pal system protein YbgF [Pseudoalteromonas tunicata]EAR26515.1 putative periplasmic protein contains a protein prenylyltransferase domain [Pseudoalteromonas tunicata D2]MDP4982872.1 tol-pal system protein YbgF [Pseudoalteromonas tunicata]MDP5213216.1 tol-pal system protein YbgF [Pseudoalteromonas tunicata]
MKPKIILAAILLGGSTQLWAAPAPVSTVGNSTSDIETRVAAIENMIKSRNLVQVELQQQFQVLQDEVSQLRGTTEEQGYKIEKILQRQRELYQEIEERVSTAYAKPSSVAVEPAAEEVSTISSNLSENDAYDRAVQMIMKDKRYDQAIPQFQTFLQQYPQSVYVPNAHYWLGQLQSMKNDVDAAKTHFEAVVNGYPDSNKRPDAMLKLAAVLQKQGNDAKAKTIMQQLIDQYPESTAAKLAKDRISKP